MIFWIEFLTFTLAGYWLFFAAGDWLDDAAPAVAAGVASTAWVIAVWAGRLLWLAFAVKMSVLALQSAG